MRQLVTFHLLSFLQSTDRNDHNTNHISEQVCKPRLEPVSNYYKHVLCWPIVSSLYTNPKCTDKTHTSRSMKRFIYVEKGEHISKCRRHVYHVYGDYVYTDKTTYRIRYIPLHAVMWPLVKYTYRDYSRGGGRAR